MDREYGWEWQIEGCDGEGQDAVMPGFSVWVRPDGTAYRTIGAEDATGAHLFTPTGIPMMDIVEQGEFATLKLRLSREFPDGRWVDEVPRLVPCRHR